MPTVPARRTLADMFVVGRPLDFDDGRGEPVVVWLQKLNPIQLGTAVRRAGAERAKVRSVRSAPDSEEYRLIWSEVLDIGDHAELVRYMLAETVVSAQMAAEAELAAAEEWSTDDYLQGLRDAWINGLSSRHLSAPDAESERVLAELRRFDEAATAASADEVEAARVELEAADIDELRRRAMERQIRNLCNTRWMEEMHRCELWLGTRRPCPECLKDPEERRRDRHQPHRERYFGDRSEIDDLATEVLATLLAAYAELSVDVIEGKDSGPTSDSESSSGSPPALATEPGSGPTAATP